MAYGASVAAALLDARPRPSAVICCNSLVAAGVYEAARDRGLAIPADLSVVAHDDDLPQVRTDRLEPALTVTRLPLCDAAEVLADLLVRRIAGEPIGRLQVTRQAEFIERASVSAPARRETGG
jgi:LacI family transcriptional regulator